MIYKKSPYSNGLSTHSRLVLAWHTGVEIGGSSTYGGTRFFNDSPFTGSEIFSVGKGDSNVRTVNTHYAYAFRGNGNVAGTGEATYHPAGIYSTGTNWLYGSLILNGNSISGVTSISTSAGVYLNYGDPTIFLQDTNNRSSMIHCNSNIFYILRGTGTNSTGWSTYNGYWPMTLDLENNDAVFGGNLTAVYNVTAYSDERLKSDWADIAPDFLSRLALVKSGTFTRVGADQRQMGVSAQALQACAPEAVTEGKDGMLTVAYGNAALVAAVELAKEVVKLRAELDELKAKLN
jgi:hypothetical protein